MSQAGVGSVKEAHDLIAAAEAATAGKKFLFFSSQPDYMEAADLYNRAAIVFKGHKEWREAGDAFRKSAEMEVKGGEADESGRKLINAASCYKKCDPLLAVQTIEEALEIFLRSGRFHLAAGHEKEIAELYETQLDNPRNAIRFYERAAERYAGEDSDSIAQSCFIKAANLAALSADYEKGARIYEEAASSSVSDMIRKYNVKDYLFRAGLCRICGEDRIAARRAIEGYPAIDVSIGSTREYQLLTDIMTAVEEDDLEKFTELVAKFDRTNPLDDWKTKMLLRVKEHISEEPGLT